MLEKISIYDLPDRRQVPDGYNMRSVPAVTADNIEYLIDRHNELVDAFNDLVAWLRTPPNA